MNHHQQELYGGTTTTAGLILPDSSSPFFPWTLPPIHHSFNNNNNNNDYETHFNTFPTNPVQEQMENHFLSVPPSVPYGSYFNRRSNNNPNFQFGYDHGGPSPNTSSEHLRLLSESVLLGSVAVQPVGSGGFGLQSEIMGKMSAQEIMDAKALAASKSHSEAERRRRERINNHLARLRSLLPSTTKTDKASLLAEVIQHVKELKRQTSLIAETSPIPTETDELTVDTSEDMIEDGKLVIKASLCCEDRSDLLPDLIKTLKSLRLRTLKAEITTLGGRVKNVLFITGENEDDEEEQQRQYCISSIQEALKAVMEKTATDQNNLDHHQSSSGNAKRQRTNHVNMR